MKFSGHSAGVILMLATMIAIVTLGSTTHARDQPFRTIYNFHQGSSDGWFPSGVPAVDKNGNLYGVTVEGGTYNWGTIFKLTAPRTPGGMWAKTLLYDFTGDNQGFPTSLIIDKDGTLYGTGGGPNNNGFIFRLAPPASFIRRVIVPLDEQRCPGGCHYTNGDC